MAKNLYISSTEAKSGKSAVVLGMMQLLLKNIRKVAIFRPIIAESAENAFDHDINLMISHFGLDIAYEDAYGCTLKEARNMINKGKKALLIDTIIKKFKNLESKYDFVLCEGTDFMGKDVPFEFELNTDIADALGTPVLIVSNGQGKTAQDIIDTTQATLDIFNERTIDVLACIINRASVSELETAALCSSLRVRNRPNQALPTYILPEEPLLGKPTMDDVRKWLNAEVLYGEDCLDAIVDNYLIAAMNPGNFLQYIDKGQVIITPGDREDIILSCFSSRASETCPNIAGVLLTGGLTVAKSVMRLISGLKGIPMPILSVEANTIRCVEVLSRLHGRIEPGDIRKIDTALAHFARHVNLQELSSNIITDKPEKMSPKMFEYRLIEIAQRHKMRIVLAEGEEERILRAADSLARRDVAEIILLGNVETISQKISAFGLELTDNVTFLQPEASPKYEQYCQKYFELRQKKGISIEQARDTMRDNTYFATMMVYQDDADGMVSGAVNTTAHTIRPAFEFIKTKPGTPIVSSIFLMCMKDRVLAFGDCAVNPNPNPAELASIAISSAHTASVFGIRPRVAMLSYSTGASGKGADVDIVKEATRIAKERAPELLLDGPIQYDAAIDQEVARTKMPDSKVAGQATVFIFPDLNTGNNTYKAVQRAASAVAIGPVLQGLNKPVNDLSRGCTVADIVNTVAITCLQAQAEKGLL